MEYKTLPFSVTLPLPSLHPFTCEALSSLTWKYSVPLFRSVTNVNPSIKLPSSPRAESLSSDLLHFSIMLLYLVVLVWCRGPCSVGVRAGEVFYSSLYPDLCLAHFHWLRSLYWSCIISTHLKLKKQFSTVHGGSGAVGNQMIWVKFWWTFRFWRDGELFSWRNWYLSTSLV